jgi:hypothetical protein
MRNRSVARRVIECWWRDLRIRVIIHYLPNNENDRVEKGLMLPLWPGKALSEKFILIQLSDLNCEPH